VIITLYCANDFTQHKVNSTKTSKNRFLIITKIKINVTKVAFIYNY